MDASAAEDVSSVVEINHMRDDESMFGLCFPIGNSDGGTNGLSLRTMGTQQNEKSYDKILELGHLEDDYNHECKVNEELLFQCLNSDINRDASAFFATAHSAISLALTYMPADVFRAVAGFL